jgi:multidrug efflux pump subunit AcrA (membrane-fusion protein)
VKKRAVEVLDLLENDALLRSGLAPGEKVVAEGASFLRDGDAVGVVP